jgi:hypothetical protein
LGPWIPCLLLSISWSLQSARANYKIAIRRRDSQSPRLQDEPHGSTGSLYSSRLFTLMQIPIQNLTIDADPDPTFHYDADPDPASQNDADPLNSDPHQFHSEPSIKVNADPVPVVDPGF